MALGFFLFGMLGVLWWVGGYWISKSGVWSYKPRGSWHKTKKGWWYGDTSGWYAKNEKIKIDGKWYTFDKEGYLVSK